MSTATCELPAPPAAPNLCALPPPTIRPDQKPDWVKGDVRPRQSQRPSATEVAGTCVSGLATATATALVLEATSLGGVLASPNAILPYAAAAFCGVLGAGAVASAKIVESKKKLTFTCGPLTWDRNAFCRGWLITGTTGSGKTVFITRMLHELCKRETGGVAQDKGGKITKLAPWGGIAIDEKGLYFETMQAVFKTYGRVNDLVLLQTKPLDKGEDWEPPVTFNLLSDDRIPANTYAHAIVKTASTIAGGEGDKGFFKTQAESNIGWGIELCRAIANCQRNIYGIPDPQAERAQGKVPINPTAEEWPRYANGDPIELAAPSLKLMLDILTSKDAYDGLLRKFFVHTEQAVPTKVRGQGPQGKTEVTTQNVMTWLIAPEFDYVEPFAAAKSGKPEKRSAHCYKKLKECLAHFATRYWALMQTAPEQILGVQGTVYNYLNYFGGDEIAQIFCGKSTLNYDIVENGVVTMAKGSTISFDMIDNGRVFCVAMPQKFAIERRYVCTILKLLYYQHVLKRFDDKESLKYKNLLIGWMDEAQRFIQPDDGNVDVLREAKATIVVATQSKTSLRPPLGGKEKADPIILNLRNRVICKAADEDCAKESADFLGKTLKTKTSRQVQSTGGNSSTYNLEDRYIIEPYQFRGIPDFTAIVCHSEGKWKSLHFTPIGNDGKEEVWWADSGKVPYAMRWRRRFGMSSDVCKAPLPKAPAGGG